MGCPPTQAFTASADGSWSVFALESMGVSTLAVFGFSDLKYFSVGVGIHIWRTLLASGAELSLPRSIGSNSSLLCIGNALGRVGAT